MIYSLRHPLRFVKKVLSKKIEEVVGEKYAIVAFSEEVILQVSPFRRVKHSDMINTLVPNSVFDPIRGVRWIKMAVHRSLNEWDHPYMTGGLATLHRADFAALFIGGKHVSTYKNRSDTMPTIPLEVHQLKPLHYFPQSGELEAV